MAISPCGYLWIYLGVYGGLRGPMDTNGRLLVLVDNNG